MKKIFTGSRSMASYDYNVTTVLKRKKYGRETRSNANYFLALKEYVIAHVTMLKLHQNILRSYKMHCI